MLVLSRRVGEEIVIGPGIVVAVKKVTRNRVRLSIQASASVRVARQEIRRSTPQELRDTEHRGKECEEPRRPALTPGRPCDVERIAARLANASEGACPR